MRTRSSFGVQLVLMTLCGWLFTGEVSLAQYAHDDEAADAQETPTLSYGVPARGEQLAPFYGVPGGFGNQPLVQAGRAIDIKSGAEGTEVILLPGQTVVLRLDAPIRAVGEFDSDVLNNVNATKDRIAIQALSAGESDMVLTDAKGVQTRIKVHIKSEVPARLRLLLEELFPDAQLQLHDVNGAVLVRGTVAKPDDVSSIASIIEQFRRQALMQADVQSPTNDLLIPSSLPSPGDESDRRIALPADWPAPSTPSIAADEGDHETAPVIAIPVERPQIVEAVPEQEDLRSEIRALHRDVKRLIELLEQRVSSPTPEPQTPPGQPAKVVPAEPASSGLSRIERFMGPAAPIAFTVPALEKLIQQVPEGRILVSFDADWAASPQEPRIAASEIAKQEGVHLSQLNVRTKVLQELAEKLGVTELPTLMVLENRKEVLRLTDLDDERKVRTFVRRALPPEYDQVWETLGVRLAPLSAASGDRAADKSPTPAGMRVTEVRTGSLAESEAATGLHQGDILIGLGIWETPTIDKVNLALSQSRTGTSANRIKFHALRDGKQVQGYLPISKPKASDVIMLNAAPGMFQPNTSTMTWNVGFKR
ncbi:MAG: hypothetical protein KF861_08285 [Planctomycetaceae bacterium]|nr:hypothetical protein [Planctomycetaceae bacterium]